MLPHNHVPPDMTAWIGRHGHVVTYYVRGGELLNVVAIRETETWVEESWSVEAQPHELMSSYARVHRDLRIVLDRIEHCFKWGLFDRDPLPSWNKGRVTLLGDAAHPMLPFLGQGAAMGFEDAWVLARELARSCKDVPAALMAYEAERRPRTTKVQLAARASGGDLPLQFADRAAQTLFSARPFKTGKYQSALKRLASQLRSSLHVATLHWDQPGRR